jgi:uncharacterized protein involved in exopolysaccharide biosynthesis
MLREEIRYEIKKAMKTDELELKSMKIKKDSLNKIILNLLKDANELNQKDRELKELERLVELQKNNYMLYASKTEAARSFNERTNRDLTNVSIADRASIPTKPSSPKRLLNLVLSIFFGLFAAFITPFFLEFLDNKLKSTSDIEDLLSLPVVCNFPEIKNN